MSAHYLGDVESLNDLVSRMPSPDREIYQSYKHLSISSAFIGRIYVLYKPTGLTAEGSHRAPEIMGQVKVLGFACDASKGCEIEIEDLNTGAILRANFIPQRLFDYDVFVSVPPYSRLRWDGHVKEGTVKRSMSFGVLFKQRTRSDFYSANCPMCETLKRFRELYPTVDLPVRYA